MIESVKIKLLTKTAQIPTRGSAGAAGFDLYSDEDCILQPGSIKLISTGIALQMPESQEQDISYYARVAPRSGLAVKQGIDVLAGVIDQDYTGEVKVCLINNQESVNGKYVEIKKGDRIAQLIFTPIIIPEFKETEVIESTDRGSAGFGSTGK